MKPARTGSSAPRRAFLRLAFTLTAAVVAAGYLSGLVHLMLVTHAVCAEHGMYSHPWKTAAGSAAAPNTASPASDSLDSDEHDHCIAGIARIGDVRTGLAAPGVLLCDDRPQIEPLDVLPPTSNRHVPPPQIDILLLSPKGSPPV